MKPICVPCQRFFRMTKSGVYFIEGMPIGRDVAPGTSEPEKWQPYKLWVGDRWECEGCGATILSGFGREPIAEHYQPEFAERVRTLQADFQVNDC
jgi:hypothetical protein